MLAHLDDEEEHILPLIEKHLTAAEWARLGERFAGEVPKRKMLFCLGAILEDATPGRAAGDGASASSGPDSLARRGPAPVPPRGGQDPRRDHPWLTAAGSPLADRGGITRRARGRSRWTGQPGEQGF